MSTKTENMNFKVKDISLADWGRKLSWLRRNARPNDVGKYVNSKPLLGARIAGCLHMTIDSCLNRNFSGFRS